MKTFAILKPGFQHLYPSIKALLDDRGIEITYVARDVRILISDVEKLYDEHRKKDFFLPNCHYMTSGPVTLMELHGITPENFRKILTNEIRPQWEKNIRENVMHASDSTLAYLRESDIFFKYFEQHN